MATLAGQWVCPYHGEWSQPISVLQQNGEPYLACPVCGGLVYLPWYEPDAIDPEEEENGRQHHN